MPAIQPDRRCARVPGVQVGALKMSGQRVEGIEGPVVQLRMSVEHEVGPVQPGNGPSVARGHCCDNAQCHAQCAPL